MQSRPVSSDCHRINLAEFLFIQGMVLLSRRVPLHTCSFFSSVLLQYYTVDFHQGTAHFNHSSPLLGAELHLVNFMSDLLLKSTRVAAG